MSIIHFFLYIAVILLVGATYKEFKDMNYIEQKSTEYRRDVKFTQCVQEYKSYLMNVKEEYINSFMYCLNFKQLGIFEHFIAEENLEEQKSLFKDMITEDMINRFNQWIEEKNIKDVHSFNVSRVLDI